MALASLRGNVPTKETLPTKVTATLPVARRTLAQLACLQAHGLLMLTAAQASGPSGTSGLSALTAPRS